jgi:integrase
VRGALTSRISRRRAGRACPPITGGAPGPTDDVRRRFWTPAVERAGLAPLRIHDLRHTAVSLSIADGADPKRVATLAGHTSVVVVLDRYGHLYPEQDDELMERLERRTRDR